MKVIKELTIKHLLLNKSKTLISIISIILATSLLFFIGIGASTIRKTNIDDAVYNYGSHHVIFNDLIYKKIDILKEDKSIEKIEFTQEVDKVFYDKLSQEQNLYLTIQSINNINENNITIINGTYPRNNNEIIISSKMSGLGAFKIGDSIENRKIVGIFNKSNYITSEYTFDGINHNFSPIAYTFQKISEENKTNFIITYNKSLYTYSKIFNTAENLGLKSKINSFGEKEYENTEVNRVLINAYGQNNDGSKQIASYVIIIILLVVITSFCVLVIRNSFEISLSERTKQLGILRSVGASKKQLFKSVMYEAFLVSVISIPIGALLSFGLTQLVIKIFNNILTGIIDVSYSLYVYPSYIIMSITFILLTIFLSSLTSARNAASISPIEAIRKNKDINIIKSKANYNFIKKAFKSEGEIAYKNIKRNGGKFSTTITTLSISIVLFIIISTYLNFAIAQNTTDNADFDISIIIPHIENTNEIASSVENIINQEDYIKYKSTFLSYKVNKNYYKEEYINSDNYFESDYSFIYLIGLEEEQYNEYKKEIDLKNNSKNIFYNNHYIKFEDKPSKRVEVFKNENMNLEICEVSEDSSGKEIGDCYFNFNNFHLTNNSYHFHFQIPSLIVPMTEYERLVEEYIGNYDANFFSIEGTYKEYLNDLYIGINTNKFQELDEKITEVLDKHSYANIIYQNNGLQNYEEYTMINSVKFVAYFILGFIAVISTTSIINTLNTSMKLRETEFAMFRSIGISKKGLNRMLRLESFFISIQTTMFAIPISMIGSFILIEMMKKLTDSMINVRYPFIEIILSITIVFLIIFISTLYSTYKIRKLNIIETIRKENI